MKNSAEINLPTDGASLSVLNNTDSQQGLRNLLILVNGYSRPKTDFLSMIRFFKNHAIPSVTFDNRGVGHTQTLRAFDESDMVSDIKAVRDRFCPQKSDYHLLGISMGGMLSQKFCETIDKHKPKALHLVSTAPSFDYLSHAQDTWGNSIEAVLEQLRIYVAPIFFEKNLILMKAMAKQIFLSQKNPSSGPSGQREATRNLKVDLTKLEESNIPIHIYFGDLDGIFASKPCIEAYSNLSNFKSATVYKDVGHLILAEHSKQFYNDVYKNLS